MNILEDFKKQESKIIHTLRDVFQYQFFDWLSVFNIELELCSELGISPKGAPVTCHQNSDPSRSG